MNSADFITIILAGGRGKRLSVLTKEMAKPAITFGGTRRLIDFTLSNCKHSHADVIGVITQYCERELADYIGSGSQWLPESESAVITTLPPKLTNGKSEFYEATADAILKNTDFIEKYDPKNILVLSGDHIYKMNYAGMLQAHDRSGAAVTIAAKVVPHRDASRFGIMDTDKNGVVIEFKEKPKSPKTNLASMGVYVFNWAKLRKYLFANSQKPKSGMDIGGNIIPQMLICGEKMVAYEFSGYWKDVGDIYSLWKANMELLGTKPSINLYDSDWEIISRNRAAVPYYDSSGSQDGSIVNSFVTEGCINKGKIMNSVISSGVEIGRDATVIDSVIMPGAKIGKGSCILKSIVGSHAIVADYTDIAGVKPDGKCFDNCQGVSVLGNNSYVSRHSSGRLEYTALPRTDAANAGMQE